MARYTRKSEADVAWDEIRREVEYRLNLAAAHAKARLKNTLLPELQRQFEVAFKKGEILPLAPGSFRELVAAVEKEMDVGA